MATIKHKVILSDIDYETLRRAAMHAKLTATFKRAEPSNEVTFYSQNDRKLVEQLDKILPNRFHKLGGAAKVLNIILRGQT